MFTKADLERIDDYSTKVKIKELIHRLNLTTFTEFESELLEIIVALVNLSDLNALYDEMDGMVNRAAADARTVEEMKEETQILASAASTALRQLEVVPDLNARLAQLSILEERNQNFKKEIALIIGELVEYLGKPKPINIHGNPPEPRSILKLREKIKESGLDEHETGNEGKA